MNLFCFPFAGGSSYSYHCFLPFLPKHIKLIPLELPGRGARINEALQTDIHNIVVDLYAQVRNQLSAPYAFYGHSMGTLLAYLLAKKIIAEKCRLPTGLFMSGSGGPSVRDKIPPRHLLPGEQFLDELRKIGGSPDEVLNNKELMHFYEPILRADFATLSQYSYAETTPFDIPLIVMTGLEENISREDVIAWQKETCKPIIWHRFTGKHFFIFDHPYEIMQLIGSYLVAPMKAYI